MYMAPEQTRGEALDGRADLFSFGSVLYMLATGRPPFQSGPVVSVMRQVATSAPEPIQSINPAIPMWLCDLIAKLHARDRQERFQSASEVEVVFAQRRGRQAVLQSAQAQPQASTLPTTSVRSTSGGRAWIQAVMLLAALCMGILVLVFLWPDGSPTKPSPKMEPAVSIESPPQVATVPVATIPVGWAGWPIDAPPPAKAPFTAKEAAQCQESWATYLGVPVEMTNSVKIVFKLIPLVSSGWVKSQEKVRNAPGA